MIRKLLVLALVLGPSAALAAETAAIAPPNVTEVKALEEIVVTGDLNSLSGAKNAVIEAEDRFYARYNDLNKDDLYDVHCRLETPKDHHSRISSRVCEPAYIGEGTHSEAMRLYLPNSNGGTVNLTSTESIRLAGLPELKKRTLELIRKDPELLRALLERARLQQHYDALRKQKLKDRRIVWD